MLELVEIIFYQDTSLLFVITLFLNSCPKLWASVAIKFKVHKSVVLTTIPPPLPSSTINIHNKKHSNPSKYKANTITHHKL